MFAQQGTGVQGQCPTQPRLDFRPPGAGRERGICADAARAEPGTHPAPLLAGDHSGVCGSAWISSSPGWLCVSAGRSSTLLSG